jgi:hypothetical protein
MTDGSDEELLARNMIDVHGAEAATLARENARGAALAGRPAQAKSWIRVLGIIQRRQVGNSMRRPGASGNPLSALSTAEAAEG